jgi:hypothetical protein
MTDDLVSSLRLNAEWSHFYVELYIEAADRIEKLEAALRELLIKCTWENTGRWCGSIDCHCRIARKALEGKDDWGITGPDAAHPAE